jgi:hypothetical protein
MNRFFARNIDWRGRLLRGIMGTAMIVGAIYARTDWPWLAVMLAMAGVFGLFEALRGWCLMRACGVKTKF